MTFIELFQKVMADELSAIISYQIMGQSLMTGYENSMIGKHLLEHADEEYGHYKTLQDFAQKHGFNQDLQFEMVHKDVIANTPTGNVTACMMYHQELETGAIDDYMAIANFAKKNGDVEVYEFFKGLMLDEQEHFDDIADFTGQSRMCVMPKDTDIPMRPEVDTE